MIFREIYGRGINSNQNLKMPIIQEKDTDSIKGLGKLYNVSKKLENLNLLSDGSFVKRKPKNIVFEIK